VIASLSILVAAGAVRTAAAPLSFSELFEHSASLRPSARVLALDGRRVRLDGFMARMEVPSRGGFYLCPRHVSADESGAGTADLPVESVFVVMRSAAGREVPYRPGLLEVTGTLRVGNRADADGRVSAFQLTLDRSASRKSSSTMHSSSTKGESR
jgi:hypothetical protein